MKYREIQKLRTKSTISVVSQLLEDISVDKLISDLFITTEDKSSMELIKEYEKVIIKGKMEDTYLRDNLNVFYKDMSRYLKKHNLFKTFTEFTYFIYSSLSNKENKTRDALNIYQNIVLQQFEYLSPEGKTVYGVTTKGKLMIKNELLPYSDYPFHEILIKKIKDPKKTSKIFKKYGYTESMMENIEFIIRDDGLVNNMILVMANFINENTEDIIPSKFIKTSENTKICNINILKDVEDIKKKLKMRKNTLPVQGVFGLYKNAGNVKSVLFKEVFQEDKMFLLYQLKNEKDEGMYGVYDFADDFFYSLYRDTTAEGETHDNIEKFVLRSYSMLTTDYEETDDLIEVDEIDNNKVIKGNPYQPIVSFLINEGKTNEGKKRKRKFDRKNYKESTVSINPYIRKLPLGATASEEAKNNARRFGYELSDDETFVSPFTRATFINKE